MALEITDPRDEEGAAHAEEFIAIVAVPGIDGAETSTRYLYPGEPGWAVANGMLAMLRGVDAMAQ